MKKPSDFHFQLKYCVPSLQAALAKEPLDLTQMIRAAVPVGGSEPNRAAMPATMDRTVLWLTDGKAMCEWKTESLSALFRGNRQPPVLGDYPQEYNESFVVLDFHALELSGFFGDRRDEEMLEIYSWLRRRPDGRSQGLVHDYMWQAAALMLGMRPLSQAEFEAILARLERSCRRFREGPASRNYIDALRQTIGRSGR